MESISSADLDAHDIPGAKPSANGKRPTTKLPAWTPDEGDPAPRFAAWLTELFGLEADPIVSGERYGKHGDASLVLVRKSGQRIRWAHQSTLQKPAGLQAVLMIEAGVKPRKLSIHDAMVVAWAMTQLSDLHADVDPAEELILWWQDYLDTRPMRSVDADDDYAWRRVLADWQQARAHDEIRGNQARMTFVATDERTGCHYVRREDFATHVRSVVRGPMSWPTLNSRVAEAGWREVRFQRKATAGGAPYLSVRLYVVPADWPEPEPLMAVAERLDMVGG